MVNLVFGALHVKARVFLLGTLLGMGPGIAVIATILDRAVAVVNDPGPDTVGVLIAVGAIAFAGVWSLQKRVARPPASAPPAAEHVG